MERFKAELANWQGEIQRNHDEDLAMLAATIENGQQALKSAVL